MDKLELDLNDLEVGSFQTAPEQENERGTVRGNVDVSADNCTGETDVNTHWNECWPPSEHYTACCSEVNNCETQNDCEVEMTRGHCEPGL